MIDLFLIQLDKDLDKVIIPETSSFFQTKTKDAFKWHQQFNPTPQHYRKYGYLPKLDIWSIKSRYGSGYFTQRVVIQASGSKLLYGTNYFGVDEENYSLDVDSLIGKTKLMGLSIEASQAETATLRAVSFCFNFFLPDGFPYPFEFLKKMSFLDIGKRHKKAKNTSFWEETEEGFACRLYNGQVGLGLYDKRAELINKGRTPEELEVVKRMQRGELPDKVLRMEVNLQNQTAVKQHLTTRLGGDRKQTRHLRDVFNNELAQAILTDVFEKLADDVDVKALEMPIYSPETAYELVRKSGMSNAEAERWVGRSYITQQIGSLKYKELQDRHYPRQRRYYLRKSHEKVLERCPLPKFTLDKIFDECRHQLAEFKVLKPTDFAPCNEIVPLLREDTMTKLKQ